MGVQGSRFLVVGSPGRFSALRHRRNEARGAGDRCLRRAAVRPSIAMNTNVFASVFYLYIFVAIIVCIFAASALEKRLKARMPDTQPYSWGFFLGCMGVASAPLAVCIAIAAVKAGMNGRQEDCGYCFVYAVFFALHTVAGWFIIQRR